MLSLDPKSSEGQRLFWKTSEEILPEKKIGDFNQALMELGATVCIPENPLCLLCPVAAFCQAREAGNPQTYPRGQKKTIYEDRILAAAVIVRDGKILLVQRSGKGLLKDLWEFPMVDGDSVKLAEKWPIAILSALPVVRHSILNRRLRITPLICRLGGGWRNSMPHRWIRPTKMAHLPTSSMNQKILNLFLRKDLRKKEKKDAT